MDPTDSSPQPESPKIKSNRERLANDTAAYFANMTDEEADEENRLGGALARSTAGTDFDQ
jgi:hypothetical protein